MPNQANGLYEFGTCRLDAAKRLVSRADKSLTLAPKTFDLLLLLVQSQGKVLNKRELMNALWPDTFVEEASLSFQIATLRKALGEEGDQWIETVPKHGYRFTAPITTVATSGAPLGSSGSPSPRLPASLPRAYVPWLMAAATSAFALVVLVLHFRGGLPVQQPVRFSISLPGTAAVTDLSLSPDGRYLAIAAVVSGKGSLWIRSLEGAEAHALGGTEDGRFPFWSPDSRFIGFFAQGKLRKIAIAGAPAQTVCDAPAGRGGTWNREGVIVFAPISGGPLYRVTAAGGAAAPVTSGHDRYPVFLPDGRHFIYSSFRDSLREDNSGIYLSSLDSKDSTLLFADLSNLAYAPSEQHRSGYILFVRGNTLMAQPMDTKRLRTDGDAIPVAERVKTIAGVQNFPFSASANGVLTWLDAGASDDSQLLWFDRQGKKLGALGEPGIQTGMALSPDSKRVAVTRLTQGVQSIWLLESTGGGASRFTLNRGAAGFPVWSPDGSQILFSADVETRGALSFRWNTAIYRKASSSAGAEERLVKAPFAYAQDWSRDGKLIAYSVFDAKTRLDIWLLPLDGDRKPIPFIQGPSSESRGRFSPDGRWIAYTSDETGREEVYVQPLPDRTEERRNKQQVSTTGGLQPCWRADGKELFYVTKDGKLMTVGIKTGATFDASPPQPLFQSRIPPNADQRVYEASPDGQRFLINTQVGEVSQAPIAVLVNWHALLNR